ncbi:MAG: hypothetical protein VR68_09075 [Peptococcaceae bacterium BRH_c4a]|nr:MAG: hypothetical protein VR68_09075 [Peptococcaceae bacterium BRH_c4a]
MENDNFDVLPGKVYVKGFIKNYATFLGLNANSMVSAYEEMVPAVPAEEEDERQAVKLTQIEKSSAGGMLKIAVGLVLAGLAFYIFMPSLMGTGKDKIVPDRTDNKTATQEKANEEKARDKQAARQGVNMILNVTDNRSWMYVEVDGKPEFTGFLASGQMKEFKGNEKIVLKLGNAGVVQVEVNGQKMGVLGNLDQVVTKEFSAPQG